MPELLYDLLTWLPELEYQPLLFVLLTSMIAVSVFIPSASLGFAAGYLYGFGSGLLYVFIGLVLGAACCFMLARWLLHGLVQRYLARFPRLVSMVGRITGNGWRLCLLIRLSPVAPFGITSYALGVSEIRWPAFMIGLVGILPNLALLVYTGSLARTMLESWQYSSSSRLVWVQVGLSVISVIALALLIRLVLRAVFNT